MASIHFLKSLKKDQILKGVVEEVSSQTELLCDFNGELLLVLNKAAQEFKKGQPICLQILSTHPLRFEVFTSTQNKFQRVI